MTVVKLCNPCANKARDEGRRWAWVSGQARPKPSPCGRCGTVAELHFGVTQQIEGQLKLVDDQ